MCISRMFTVTLWLFSGCVLMAMSGCGGSEYGSPVKLSGNVLVDEKPLANAIVTFNSTEPREPAFRAFTVTANGDGIYETEIYPGTYEVSVSEGVAEDADPGRASALAGQDLKPATGELQAIVGTEPQTFDVKLVRGRMPAL